MRKGESECQYYIDKLEYLDDKQRDPLIDNCKTLLCHGELRNKSGSVRIYNYSPYNYHPHEIKLSTYRLCCSKISSLFSIILYKRVTSQRLHVFLFSELLVLTRPVTRNDRSCFQVYRQPIPVRDLALEDLQDGEIRMGGSFRGAFTNGERGGLS